jgi:hypothetical protein
LFLLTYSSHLGYSGKLLATSFPSLEPDTPIDRGRLLEVNLSRIRQRAIDSHCGSCPIGADGRIIPVAEESASLAGGRSRQGALCV